MRQDDNPLLVGFIIFYTNFLYITTCIIRNNNLDEYLPNGDKTLLDDEKFIVIMANNHDFFFWNRDFRHCSFFLLYVFGEKFNEIS